jgi:predicted metalloprotease
MRLDKEEPSRNVEDRRGQGGGMGFPGGLGGGRRINIPMGGGRGGGMSISTIVILVIVYFALKMLFGIDLLQVLNGGGGIQLPGGQSSTEYSIPNAPTDSADTQGTGAGTGTADVTTDAGKDFVQRVLGSTERVWGGIFQQMGKTYQEPPLVLFSGFVQLELQADCFAGIWAQEANEKSQILEEGDIEEGLNAAAAIGDDRLQKRSQGYVVPESFTHGTSAQRVGWFKKGFAAKSLQDCDTFAADSL